MDFEGPYYSSDLFSPNGKLVRLHKGGSSPKNPLPTPAAPSRGTLATNTGMAKEKNPYRKIRGMRSTILTGGLDTNFGGSSILGG